MTVLERAIAMSEQLLDCAKSLGAEQLNQLFRDDENTISAGVFVINGSDLAQRIQAVIDEYGNEVGE